MEWKTIVLMLLLHFEPLTRKTILDKHGMVVAGEEDGVEILQQLDSGEGSQAQPEDNNVK